MGLSQKIVLLLLSVGFLLPASCWSFSDSDLMSLSLEELTSLEVTSIGRKPQKVSEMAAAVFVITQEDIRRSGVTSIPEALRMVPGLSVARIDGSKWAISSRGFNGRFANKLLVLIDGRSVYSPLFSGVYWDIQDTLLDDIERIEVVRGPGATLWGSNAVNGVINVITKKARDTQGLLVKAGAGTEEKGFAALRYGGEVGENVNYRAFVKYLDRDRLQSNKNAFSLAEPSDDWDTHDDWNAFRGGFRLEAEPGLRDEFTLQGEAFSGTEGQQDLIWSLDPALNYQRRLVSDTQFAGGHILARWRHRLVDGSDFALQAYYDRSYRDEEALVKEVRDVFDLDFQHRFRMGERHEVLWGAGYRFTGDDLEDGELITVEDDSRSDQVFSFFLQDEMTLIPDRLRLLIGSKLEHNDYSGLEFQPNIRLLWTPHEQHVFWGAVSRAVRTPSRLEDSFTIFQGLAPPGFIGNPIPVKLVIAPSKDFESEKSISYELGYRYFSNSGFHLDTALFYTYYWDHRSGEEVSRLMEFQPIPHVVASFQEGNKMRGETYGLEMTADWHVRSWWRLQGNYSLLKVKTRMESDSTDQFIAFLYDDSSPQQQCSLRSSFNIGNEWELDFWLRYVDRIAVYTVEIDDYFSLDLRLAWKPIKGLELALIGQNLLEDRHEEFQAELGAIPTAMPRGFYGQITWQY